MYCLSRHSSNFNIKCGIVVYIWLFSGHNGVSEPPQQFAPLKLKPKKRRTKKNPITKLPRSLCFLGHLFEHCPEKEHRIFPPRHHYHFSYSRDKSRVRLDWNWLRSADNTSARQELVRLVYKLEERAGHFNPAWRETVFYFLPLACPFGGKSCAERVSDLLFHSESDSCHCAYRIGEVVCVSFSPLYFFQGGGREREREREGEKGSNLLFPVKRARLRPFLLPEL